MLRTCEDENEKLRLTIRDCDADVKLKTKYGRMVKGYIPPKKTKHPKLGSY